MSLSKGLALSLSKGISSRLKVGSPRGGRIFFFLLVCLSGCSFFDSEEPQATVKKPDSYDTSLKGSIFGSVSNKEISDALPEKITNAETLAQFRERGKYVTKVAACGSCHGEKAGDPLSPLIGGQTFRDQFGAVQAPNLTPVTPGLGDWTLKDIGSAIRASLGKDSHPISLEAHRQYRWLSDGDTVAVAAYLKSLKPIRHDVDRRELGTFERNSLVGLISRYQPIFGFVPSPVTNNPREYGRYLVYSVTGCMTCHTSDGGVFSDGEPLAGRETVDDLETIPRGGPDIRGAKEEGLKKWSAADYVAYLDSGVKPDKKRSNGQRCPWPFFQGLSSRDKQAIADYLKGI